MTYVRLIIIVMVLAAIAGGLMACTREAPRYDPIILPGKEVERIVQQKCEDTRPPAPDYPDDDAELAAVDENDPLAIYILSQMYRAARALYRARLAADDVQITACARGRQ
jgi:hypothetical protein